MTDWQPGTSLEVLKHRARLLKCARDFFAKNNYLEVETPVLSVATVTDPHIESFTSQHQGTTCYLHTSPEFPMKRLLVAHGQAIYQICKVFRQGESGRNHNPEFTLLEWYQPGFSYRQLMQQLDALVRCLLEDALKLNDTVCYTYAEVFQMFAGFDPHTASLENIATVVQQHQINIPESLTTKSSERDSWLDLVMTHIIQAQLPQQCPVFIYDYPASQAALARLHHEPHVVAERFELYINSIELANGYQELRDASELRQRFEQDNSQRQVRQQTQIPLDENLLAAMEAGLPDCAGVALGFDRLMMLATGAASISEVMGFTIENA